MCVFFPNIASDCGNDCHRWTCAGEVATELLQRCSKSAKKQSLIATNPSDATRILDDPDYSLVKALQTAQQNFVITDPSLPDNPIVFASHGFLTHKHTKPECRKFFFFFFFFFFKR